MHKGKVFLKIPSEKNLLIHQNRHFFHIRRIFSIPCIQLIEDYKHANPNVTKLYDELRLYPLRMEEGFKNL